jgi:hypothetical protein
MATLSNCFGARTKRRTFGGASPRIFGPTDAGANVGHPFRFVGVKEWITNGRDVRFVFAFLNRQGA